MLAKSFTSGSFSILMELCVYVILIPLHIVSVLVSPSVLLDRSVMFFVISVNLCSGTSISAEVDEVELEDGTKIQPVSVIFPDGHSVPAQQEDEVQLCTISKM